ncbi:MAG: Na/Pi cotransporter family protein [Xanthomonadaceae bacterium]|nr:Na/Pi cotransporter family protein [Xanthomonadaceae bacterium]
MNYSLISGIIGGLGLFLLGMQLMTDGLKLAAGNTLRNILSRSTSTPLRGIMTGVLITSLVQSSSAVTVSTIGFVNAGLMNLTQAITVIYGTNIGTTMTGWLVALVGFHLKIEILSLPVIGIGMGLFITRREQMIGYFGKALAGLGIFFLGIGILKQSMAGVGTGFNLGSISHNGVFSLLLYLGIGLLMTIFMQSSSASIAIILTSVSSGIVPIETAAAMVIGANVGTTSTALLAAIGATPNAKRVAAAHIAFNLITGLVALLILPLLLYFIRDLRSLLGLSSDPPEILALFHTIFNVLGVLLLWPLTGWLVHRLEKWFRTGEEDENQPRFLDHTLASTPVLAMHALAKELARIGDIAYQMAKSAISAEKLSHADLPQERQNVERLVVAVGDFSAWMSRQNLPKELDVVLPNALRVSRYYAEMAELAEMVEAGQSIIPPLDDEILSSRISHYKSQVVKLLKLADMEKTGLDVEECSRQLRETEDEYQQLKAGLLRAGAQGRLSVRLVVDHLDILSNIRRMAQQSEKAIYYLATLEQYNVPDTASRENSGEVEAKTEPGIT